MPEALWAQTKQQPKSSMDLGSPPKRPSRKKQRQPEEAEVFVDLWNNLTLILKADGGATAETFAANTWPRIDCRVREDIEKMKKKIEQCEEWLSRPKDAEFRKRV
jgi:hypothetical protein